MANTPDYVNDATQAHRLVRGKEENLRKTSRYLAIV